MWSGTGQEMDWTNVLSFSSARFDNNKRGIKEKERKSFRRSKWASGSRIFHIHVLSSSGLFRWHKWKIAAGFLYLSLSPILPLILYSFLLSLSLPAFFVSFTIQCLMYREGSSLRLCAYDAPAAGWTRRTAHIFTAIVVLTHAKVHQCVDKNVFIKTCRYMYHITLFSNVQFHSFSHLFFPQNKQA